jgi:hypothetical protein
MLIYSFHVYLWPKNIFKKLDCWIRTFVWIHLVHRIHEVVIPRTQFDDKLVWTDSKDGCLMLKQAYRVLFSPTAAPD